MQLLEAARSAQRMIENGATGFSGEYLAELRDGPYRAAQALEVLRNAGVYLELDPEKFASAWTPDGKWIPYTMPEAWMGTVQLVGVEYPRVYLMFGVSFNGFVRPVRIFVEQIKGGFTFPPGAVLALFGSLLRKDSVDPQLQSGLTAILGLESL